MKILLTIILLVAATGAQASYFHVKCSNASGSVKWESGHNSNSITFDYYDAGHHEAHLSLRDVSIKEIDMVTISDKKVSDCAISRVASSTTVTAGKVVITASEASPGSMDQVHGKKIEAEVICERHVNGMMYCPNN